MCHGRCSGYWLGTRLLPGDLPRDLPDRLSRRLGEISGKDIVLYLWYIVFGLLYGLPLHIDWPVGTSSIQAIPFDSQIVHSTGGRPYRCFSRFNPLVTSSYSTWVTSQHLLSMMFLTYEIIDTRIVQLRCLNHPHYGFVVGPTLRSTQRQDGDTRIVGLAYIIQASRATAR